MIFEYEEKEQNFKFRYWINSSKKKIHDNIFTYIDINEWVASYFGPIGEKWGWERIVDSCQLPFPMIYYSWRFQNKEDAVLFKMRWHGNE